MKDHKNQCLRCKYFRLDNDRGGVCRVDRQLAPDYPHKDTKGTCGRWFDCGQQYYIRLGWLKRALAELPEEKSSESETLSDPKEA
jgi:hypothetical protein